MGRKGKSSDLLKKRITKQPDKQLPYARVFCDLFDSPQFQALTPTARLLYIDMSIRCGGQDDFTFPRRSYNTRYSPAVFKRAKDQLVQAGFITETPYYKQDTLYRISSDWMRAEPIRAEKPKRGRNLKT